MAPDGEIRFLETCGRVVLKFLMNATTGAHCFFLFFPLMGLCSAMLFLDGRFYSLLVYPIYACDLLVLFPEIQTNGYVSFMLDSGF
jgi:hypothetical protein